MSGDNTRFRVKLGGAEIEYEGSEQFLKAEVIPTVAKIFELVEIQSELRQSSEVRFIEAPRDVLAEQGNNNQKFDHSTTNIAVILGTKTAVDLALAAAAHLTIVRGRDSFTRQELLEALRSAPSFYKKADANNHSKTLQSLVKSGQLREGHGGNYALTAKIRSELEQKLVDAA
jgi:hypothetical protein